MTAKTSARRTAKALVAGIACALAVTGTLAAVPAATAHAATASARTAATQRAAARHANGESVVIPTGKGTSVYAEWYKVSGKWVAVFKTDNGTIVHATKSGGKWGFAAVTKSGKVAIIRTQYESTKVGKAGPAGRSSHWRAKTANVWY